MKYIIDKQGKVVGNVIERQSFVDHKELREQGFIVVEQDEIIPIHLAVFRNGKITQRSKADFEAEILANFK